MKSIGKGLYVEKDNEKAIVFVFDLTVEGDAVYTEALHPVGTHYVSAEIFNDKYKKVHKVQFAETE